MITLHDIKKALDENFCEPFCHDGTVRTWVTGNEDALRLHIQIAGRDIELNENGKVVGAGTGCDEGCEP